MNISIDAILDKTVSPDKMEQGKFLIFQLSFLIFQFSYFSAESSRFFRVVAPHALRKLQSVKLAVGRGLLRGALLTKSSFWRAGTSSEGACTTPPPLHLSLRESGAVSPMLEGP